MAYFSGGPTSGGGVTVDYYKLPIFSSQESEVSTSTSTVIESGTYITSYSNCSPATVYNIFNEGNTTVINFKSNGTVYDNYAQIQLPIARKLKEFVLSTTVNTAAAQYSITKMRVLGSNDGTNWDTVKEFTGYTSTTALSNELMSVESSTAYKYYRFNFYNGGYEWTAIKAVTLHLN